MGLDGVELVMEFEDSFGVELTDEETIAAQTPRMVIDLILSKLETAQETGCLSQRAFYLVRRTLTEHVGVARRAITADTELRTLIGRNRAAQLWPTLERAVQARVWPALARPALLVAALYTLGCAVFVGAFFAALPTGVIEGAGFAFVVTLVFAVAVTLAIERYQTRIPDELRQIRDLIPYAGTSDQIAWTREKVSLIVKMLVIEQLGLSESDYHEDARFAEDLGMD